MSFYLNIGTWNSVFALPTELVDKHLTNCDEYSLKLILFLLRNPQKVMDEKTICEKTGIPLNKITPAINYWVKVNLLVYDNNKLSPCIPNGNNKNNNNTQTQPIVHTPQRMLRPDSIYIAQRLSECEELKHIFANTEAILGKTLSPSFCAVLLIAYDDYCLPAEVIVMMVNYCVSIGKTTTTFVEALAKNWHELQINSIVAAEARIAEMGERNSAWKKLSALLSIPNRQAIKAELDLAHTALYEMKFSKEMILIAYEKTIQSTGKFQAKYMLKILENWYSKKIFNPQDLEKSEPNLNTKTSKNNENTSYNISDYDNLNVFDLEDMK